MNPLQRLIEEAACTLPKERAPERPARSGDARPRPGERNSGLRAVLRLEIIGDDWFDYRRRLKRGLVSEHPQLERHYMSRLGRDAKRPWVARLTGFNAEGSFERQFQRGQRDYSEANKAGSRGVNEYYALTAGVYEVFERTSWTRTRRYYLRVESGRFWEVDEAEVIQCLR